MLIIGLFLATALTGCFCTQKAEVLPKSSLPNAILGIPYYAEIEVYNGRVINDSFQYLITPENSGLEISPTDFGTHVSLDRLH